MNQAADDASLRSRLEDWRQAFEGDINSIVQTLVRFATNYSTYMTVVRIVERSQIDEAGNKPLNPLIMMLLKDAYWSQAIVSIRRLVDSGPLRGNRGVMSLRSVLNDIETSQGLLTRRAYVEVVSGRPYDSLEVQDRLQALMLAGAPGPFAVPRELEVGPIERRHEEFDFLSGVATGNRTPADLIDQQIFERLKARLEHVDDIAEHATIYFAHAATPSSRAARGLKSLSPDDVVNALRILVETAELMGRWFLDRTVGPVLPSANADTFEHLDKPLLHDGDTSELSERWDAFAAEAAAWTDIEGDAL